MIRSLKPNYPGHFFTSDGLWDYLYQNFYSLDEKNVSYKHSRKDKEVLGTRPIVSYFFPEYNAVLVCRFDLLNGGPAKVKLVGEEKGVNALEKMLRQAELSSAFQFLDEMRGFSFGEGLAA